MALDEVAVICPVDLPAMLADAAGKGILIMPVVHGIASLRTEWGKAGGADHLGDLRHQDPAARYQRRGHAGRRVQAVRIAHRGR